MDKPFYTVFISLTFKKDKKNPKLLNNLSSLYHYHWRMATTLYTHSTQKFLSSIVVYILFDVIFYIKF